MAVLDIFTWLLLFVFQYLIFLFEKGGLMFFLLFCQVLLKDTGTYLHCSLEPNQVVSANVHYFLTRYCLSVLVNIRFTVTFTRFHIFADTFGRGSRWYTRIPDWTRRDWIFWEACQRKTPTVAGRQTTAKSFVDILISSLRKADAGLHACSNWLSQGRYFMHVRFFPGRVRSGCIWICMIIDMILYSFNYLTCWIMGTINVFSWNVLLQSFNEVMFIFLIVIVSHGYLDIDIWREYTYMFTFTPSVPNRWSIFPFWDVPNC